MVSDKNDEMKWVEVFQVASLSEGEIVKALLESAGVKTKLNYDATSGVILGPGSVNPWSKVSIYVKENDKEIAAELIEEAVDEEMGEESQNCDEWRDRDDEE